MSFTITKVSDKNFNHFDGFKEMNFSNWEIVFNNTANTLILQMRNGAPFPKKEVLATDVIIKDGISGTPETFTTTAQIRARLIELGYNALVTSGGGGGAVDSVNGQTGTVVLDADDINETATRKWQSADQDTFNDATSSIQTQLDSKLTIETPTTTGVALTFATDRVYGSIASPETGNITASTTGAKLGVTNIIIHNSGTAPTFDSKFKKLSGSGSYVISVVNYIYCTYITSTEIIYSINQRT